MDTKYKEGEIVYERIRPTIKMIISSYKNGLYYCRLLGDFRRKPLAYFERELNQFLVT